MDLKTPCVQEVYKDFTPSVNVKNTVEILLGHVPPEDLAGLGEILLTNTAALSRERKRRRRSSRSPISDVLGRYYQAWKGQPARIEIFVDNILKSWPRYGPRLPFVRKFMFYEVLYHEIGHHVQYVSNSQLIEKEDFAERYKKKLSSRFFRQRYLYCRPLRLLGKALYWVCKKTGFVKYVEERTGKKIEKGIKRKGNG